MKTSDFYYDLPEELIAQTPLQRRDASRLMVLNRETGEVTHRHFYDILEYLTPGDCLVMNDSRVLPARLLGHRPTGGAVEVLLLRDLGEGCWECLCKPGRKMQPGNQVIFGGGELTATVEAVQEDGNRLIRFHYEGIFLEVFLCLRISKQSWRIRSGIRPSTPGKWAPPPRLPRDCILPGSCWTKSGKKG